ncbi:MAG: amino acid ABC transporter permease [Egibacteraceae bacterium]
MTAGPVDTTTLEPTAGPEPTRPPTHATSPGTWLRENLFNTWYNSLLTVVFAALLAWVIYRGLRFVFVTGRWDIIRVNLTNFAVGRYPRGEIPRIWAGIYVIAAVVGLGAGVRPGPRTARSRLDAVRRGWPLVVLLLVLLAFTRTPLPALLTLGSAAVAAACYLLGRALPRGLARRLPWLYVLGLVAAYAAVSQFGGVGWGRWGGLLLTLFLATGGIVLSFPIGLLLGLGRRSSFPAIRVVCVGYIELIRGVPLITLLFMSGVALGFFLPPGWSRPEQVTRALVALIAFTAAYIAEIVRGGLQSVPRGQMEAAQAIGLSPIKTTSLIILPQALRNVIPAIVGQFISLFKDTSLVTFLGLLELLGVAQTITQQPDFLGAGLQAEALVFASFVYWSFCYSMSRASQRLEKRLGVGER